MKQLLLSITTLLSLSVSIISCKSGAGNLFKPASPHEQYQRKLADAGLDQTVMGSSWARAASQSLTKALPVNLPYKTEGYFAAEKIPAVAYAFAITRGQKINVLISTSAARPVVIYTDLWLKEPNGTLKRVGSVDTTYKPLSFDAAENGTCIIRLQPELLGSGPYTLQITTGPSLGFPLQSNNRKQIQSYFGAGRDAGSRKHEGVDIFSAFHTPVIAVAPGVVTRVNENNLGGRVVWMRPEGKNYTLYYAHLDRQIATEGQRVNPGDTLGLMGNTGNAKTTSPHLHFGIYTSSGAIDPLPFIDPYQPAAPKITAQTALLNKVARTKVKTAFYASASLAGDSSFSLPPATIVFVRAAFRDIYEAELPDGRTGFIRSNTVVVPDPLRKIKVNSATLSAYDQPDEAMALKTTFSRGNTISVLGSFSNYLLVSDETNETAWIPDKGSWKAY